MIDYKDCNLFYNNVVSKLFHSLYSEYESEVNKNPMLLLEYLKEIDSLRISNCLQSFIYPFAKLSVEGCMPLIEEECRWSRKRITSLDDKPKFIPDKSENSDDERTRVAYQCNPFTCVGSDFGDYDGAFDLFVNYEYLNKHKNTFDVTIIVDKDYYSLKAYKDNPLYIHRGQAIFVFRVNTENNDNNAIKVLDYLKKTIISQKVKMVIDRKFDNMADIIATKLYSEILNNK